MKGGEGWLLYVHLSAVTNEEPASSGSHAEHPPALRMAKRPHDSPHTIPASTPECSVRRGRSPECRSLNPFTEVDHLGGPCTMTSVCTVLQAIPTPWQHRAKNGLVMVAPSGGLTAFMCSFRTSRNKKSALANALTQVSWSGRRSSAIMLLRSAFS